MSMYGITISPLIKLLDDKIRIQKWHAVVSYAGSWLSEGPGENFGIAKKTEPNLKKHLTKCLQVF